MDYPSDSLPRLSPGEPGFETWQLQVNDEERQFGWRIRFTRLYSGDGTSTATVEFAYSNRYNPEKENRLLSQNFGEEHFAVKGSANEPFGFRAGDIVLTEEFSQGILSTFEETIRWKLEWFNDPDTGRALWPMNALYRWKNPATKLLTPQPRIRPKGKISIGALDVELEEAFGHVSHWWGTRLPESWHRTYCSGFQETDFASLEAITLKTKFGIMPVPGVTLVQLELYGELFEFTGISHMLSTASDYSENRWLIAAENDSHRLQVELQTSEDTLMESVYPVPGDSDRHVRYSGVASMQVTLSERLDGEWHQKQKLTCPDAAAFEVGRVTPVADRSRRR
ncbi:MAG: hypothetical protein K9N46_00815 [Candidatus Marinimicrobia bacterium]|nr:hypothetical protein [Candidatus Neomarinimicrobiota bacterium]MCF7827982.1 hypothetical protein [Candidatus Neomarinimicrobiota bacterium]MCF7879263.1 hypothetical protein [Candidatus Neomarinimicrobiota bacterium]